MNQSPTATPTMDFPEAIQKIIMGRRIHRLEWKDTEYYGILRDNILMLHKPDGDYQWIINEGDLLGKDWIVLPDYPMTDD